MGYHGFEVSKKHIEARYERGNITQKQLHESIKKLRENYRNGTARKELEKAGIPDWRKY